MINRGGTGGARRPQGLLRGDVEGHVGGRRAAGIADTGGIRPQRLQDWRATAPEIAGLGGRRPCRLQDGMTLSPHGRRLSGTESLRYVQGSLAAGQLVEG